MRVEKPEVLSPAGSMEALVAAVRSGADAVYLGAKEFSARRNAENFDNSQLAEAVRYCHIRGVKVYLTLNIMIKPSEMNKALNTAREAYLSGVDGIIIQDIGLAKLIRKNIPNLALHASTQMTVHSPAALSILKEMGFVRVVAAREMSRAALKKLCQAAEKLGVEIEMFVHGALCMSVSGQCLLSSVLGARSGNRGLCAGPCRLPFSAEGGTGYDLSLKDLSLFKYIDEIKEIGIASLKIEGRMKRPEYVAAATSACRAAVDNGAVPEGLSSLLKNVFSRSGFTDGYFTNTTGREMFGIRTKDDVDLSKEAFSFLHEIYRAERQSVGIGLKAVIKSSFPMELTVTDGVNIATVFGDIPQAARNRSVTDEDIRGSLTKLGGTPYFSSTIQLQLDEGLFIPGSALNELRRSAVAELDRLRSDSQRTAAPIEGAYEKTINLIKKQKIIARFRRAENIPEELSGAYAVMLPCDEDFPDTLPSEILRIAELPRWISDDEVLKKRLTQLFASGVEYAYCSNLSAVSLAKQVGMKIMGGIGLNICNAQSADEAAEMGVSFITLSAELSLNEASKLPVESKGIFAYGRLPLMLMKNCPIRNGTDCRNCNQNGFLTDRKSIHFPVHCTNGYSELLNSAPIYLADRLSDTKGFDFLLLYFTDESPQAASKIIKEYMNEGLPPKEYTRGLYYRKIQ